MHPSLTRDRTRGAQAASSTLDPSFIGPLTFGPQQLRLAKSPRTELRPTCAELRLPVPHIHTHLPMCDEQSQFMVSNGMTTPETDCKSADRLEADDLLRFFLESSK